MVFAAILAAGMSVEKQLEAAQKFLRGIHSLTSYEEVRDKQALHVGVQKALDKVQCFAAAQGGCVAGTGAARLLGVTSKRSPSVRMLLWKRGLWKSIRLVALTLREPGHAQREGLQTTRSWNAWEPCCSTHRDVPPHPILHGFSLIPASYEEVTNAWREQLGWNQMYTCLTTCILLANGWRSWHGTSLVSRRENRIREFLWCRRCAWLLRQARRSLRAAKVEAETSP